MCELIGRKSLNQNRKMVSWRTCPTCTKVCGADESVCKCGHVFGKVVKMAKKRKRRISPVVSQGAWVGDDIKGMPKISVPPPLEHGGKLSKDEILEYVSYEGLGFCVQSYIDSERIEDGAISLQWKKVKEEMDKLVDILWEY